MKLSPKAQASLDRVIEKFKNNDLSAIVTIARIHRDPNDQKPFDAWSFNNQVLALMQTDSTDCRGFRQWKKAKRHVKKGEHAAYILAPLTKKIKGETPENDSFIIYGFKTVAVFADHQTEGEPLPEFNYTPAQLPPLSDIAEKLGVDVEYCPLPPDRLEQHNNGSIKLATHDTKTFFHELAHACHPRTPDAKKGQDPHRETVAEFTATVLMELYGLGDRTGNCWDYIQMHSKDPLTAINKALADVAKVLELIEAA